MKRYLTQYLAYLSDRDFVFSTITGFSLLVTSLSMNYIAASYAALSASNSVRDILLDNLPVINTDFIFSEGAILFVLFITMLLLIAPKRIPFVLKSVALFIVIRSLFVVMTHLAPSPEQIVIPSTELISKLTSRKDLFFSGHTGLPFLFALIFWKDARLRVLFIASSIIAAASVIFGHLHYSIDVFAAYFITYGIFHIALKLFRQDRQLFERGLQHPVS